MTRERGGGKRTGQALGGAFLLHGEDAFRKEAALRELIEAHLDPATRDFNLDLLRGTEVDPQTLASVLATPPMMAEWRVVVLREVEGLAGSKHAREELLRVVSDPPPGLALLMTCTVPKGSKAKFYTDLQRLARSTELRPLAEEDAPGWLMARAREEHRIELDVEAARALAGAIGTDLGVLAQELGKLASFAAGRGRITLDDVRAAGTSLPTQDRWAWFDLVGERRFEQARAALPVLLAQGESAVGLVIALTTHMLRLGIAAERGAAGLEAALPPHQRWLARRLRDQARKWTTPEIDEALDGLREVDRMLKASPHTDLHFLETWLLAQRVLAEAA
ncbi:MAG TPA: DNA polymerase III subunit delta [Longimicrobiales bacterium]|nr:DNA polymerase III subunit delta [Longimicrobiales bacterium]